MTVNIEGSALSISESLDSLKVTPLVMHRITFQIADIKTWYAIMNEARVLYGKDWRGQPHVKRRIEKNRFSNKLIAVWFEVPDPAFATWIAVKHAVIAGPAVGK